MKRFTVESLEFVMDQFFVVALTHEITSLTKTNHEKFSVPTETEYLRIPELHPHE